jgi:chromosome segregation ATPase
MSTKEILIELKAHIKELTTEKDRLHEDLKIKDSRIKQLLQKIEIADDEVRAMGKKITENNRRMEEMTEQLAETQKTLESLQPKTDDAESPQHDPEQN